MEFKNGQISLPIFVLVQIWQTNILGEKLIKQIKICYSPLHELIWGVFCTALEFNYRNCTVKLTNIFSNENWSKFQVSESIKNCNQLNCFKNNLFYNCKVKEWGHQGKDMDNT